MSYILHLGHQSDRRLGHSGLDQQRSRAASTRSSISTRSDSSEGAPSPLPLRSATRAPQGDLWLGFRYVPPNGDAEFITETTASFLEFYDAAMIRIAQVKPQTTTKPIPRHRHRGHDRSGQLQLHRLERPAAVDRCPRGGGRDHHGGVSTSTVCCKARRRPPTRKRQGQAGPGRLCQCRTCMARLRRASGTMRISQCLMASRPSGGASCAALRTPSPPSTRWRAASMR